MQGVKRKITYVLLFEFFALLMMTVIFKLFSEQDLAHSGALGVITMVIAILWNLVYNTGFEYWEKHRARRGRSLKRRIVHAVGFETGLMAITLPIFAWWLQLSLVEAFWLDAGLTLLFTLFTFVYNWCFDRVWGLPLAAQ